MVSATGSILAALIGPDCGTAQMQSDSFDIHTIRATEFGLGSWEMNWSGKKELTHISMLRTIYR